MEDKKFIDELISNQKLIIEIEDKTLELYKKLYRRIQLVENYKQAVSSLKNDPSYDVSVHFEYENNFKDEFNPEVIVDQFISPNLVKTKIKNLIIQVNLLIEELIIFSEKYNFFWEGCSFKIYKKYYEDFFLNFKEILNIEEKKMFIEYELNCFANGENKNTKYIHKTPFIDYFVTLKYNDILFEANKLKFKFENDKKIEFLISELNKEGFDAKFKKGEFILKKIKNIKTSKQNEVREDDVLNISELPEFSLLERHLLFKKLGFLELIESLDTTLKNKNTLSAIILKCSPYSIKKFKYNYYIKGSSKDVKDEKFFDANDVVDDFLYRNKIVINNKK
jgi:hypothetical protein